MSLLGVLLLGWATNAYAAPAAHIVGRFVHDRHAFTQGLLIHDGVLYESTGRNGASELRRIELASGRVIDAKKLDDDLFGEGLALANGRLYQLTWKAGRVLVYDADSLARVHAYRYQGEGWGLTWDGAHLIMSDGSATLRFIDPQGFEVVRRVTVHENGRPLTELNELEYIDGEIWANRWFSDRILRIDPDSGAVIARLDAAPLRAALGNAPSAGVLNGIAWDADARRLYLTGKYWPTLFEVAPPADLGRVVPR